MMLDRKNNKIWKITSILENIGKKKLFSWKNPIILLCWLNVKEIQFWGNNIWSLFPHFLSNSLPFTSFWICENWKVEIKKFCIAKMFIKAHSISKFPMKIPSHAFSTCTKRKMWLDFDFTSFLLHFYIIFSQNLRKMCGKCEMNSF